MSIVENPFTGAPLYLKDSAWANKYFGGQTMSNIPKRKFTYACGFIPNRSAFSTLEGGIELARALSTNTYIFMAKTFEPPSYKIDSEILDQYNKKRVIQTRINYDPVSITFHDDVDNKITQLVDMYVKYYYSDSLNVDYLNWRLDTTSDFVNEGFWGSRLPKEKNLFQAIWVAWINGGSVTYAIMYNPIASDIKFDTLDYSDNTPLEISMTFDYEGVVFKDINAPINLQGGINGQTVSTIRDILFETEEIGQFFEGPHTTQRPGQANRSPGLGEVFNTAATFFGKHNGRPTIKDALKDFVFRPLKGAASGALNSWGNFNFGGIGQSKSQGGLLGDVGNAVGNIATGTEQTIRGIFAPRDLSAASDTRANSQLLSSTGTANKFTLATPQEPDNTVDFFSNPTRASQ